MRDNPIANSPRFAIVATRRRINPGYNNLLYLPFTKSSFNKMKFLKQLIVFLFINTICFAQGQWVWMKGDSVSGNPNSYVRYGLKGVPDVANNPGGRYESAEWTDKKGNLWLFSGSSLSANDLWKYDPVSNKWTWMNGDSTAVPNYGIKGVMSPNNQPGARGWGVTTWTDTSGNLWMFGGLSEEGYWNDLWKYDVNANQWIWMHGSKFPSQKAVFGVKGIPALANTPSSRNQTSCAWVDDQNNLWFYGGNGYCNAGFGLLNDLWKYNIVMNQWTWMGGKDAINVPPTYGQKGVAASTNNPGSRMIYSNWRDNKNNLWLFGGMQSNDVFLNDLWKYNINADQWTWVSGNNTPNEPIKYSSTCVPDSLNMPGGRDENRTEWTDDCGNFWFYGGEMYNGVYPVVLGDIWKYNPSINQWSLMAIDKKEAVYGTMGTPSYANTPGARMGSLGWKNESGFWLWGGFKTNAWECSNELWKYIPDAPKANFTFNITSCGNEVIFADSSVANCNEIKSYTWNFGDTSSIHNTFDAANPTHRYDAIGNYNVKLIVTNCTGSKDSVIKNIVISTLPSFILSISPDTAICLNDTAALSASGGVDGSYVWTPANLSNSVTGNTAFFNPSVTTWYEVVGTDADGCSKGSNVKITVLPLPVIDAGKDIKIQIGESILLNGAGGISCEWWPKVNIDCSNCYDPVVNPYHTTVYHLTVTDLNNCKNYDSLTIYVKEGNDFYIPSSFTPNGDSNNDVFYVYSNEITVFEIKIFNRWGEPIFTNNSLDQGWDGRYAGNFVPQGTYLYTLKYSTLNAQDKVYLGYVTVVN